MVPQSTEATQGYKSTLLISHQEPNLLHQKIYHSTKTQKCILFISLNYNYSVVEMTEK